MASLALAGLIAGLGAGAIPAHAADGAATPEGGSPRPPPGDDRRLPDDTVKSPGFPSALAGKCRTAQDCAAYCAKHPSETACRKDRKTTP